MRLKKRGIEPIVAVLLLVTIAVIASVLVYLWVTGFIGAATPTQTPAELKEEIKIEAAYADYDATNKVLNVTAYVRNVGEKTVTLAGMYIDVIGPGGSITGGYTKAADLSVKLGPGEVAEVSGSISNISLEVATSYTIYVKVTTSKGVETVYSFTYMYPTYP